MTRLAILSLLFCTFTASVFAADPAREKAAQAAAENFLATVDSGNYADSWNATSTAFKSALSKNQWAAALDKVRKPLGSLQSRKLISANYTHQLPGAPDGDYVVVQYNTSFQNKKNAVETVTPMLDKDGQWRVSGYYIK